MHHNLLPTSGKRMMLERLVIIFTMTTFFIMPLARIELFHKTPVYALPLAWNILPDHVRYQHNKCTFKIALLDFLFEKNPFN